MGILDKKILILETEINKIEKKSSEQQLITEMKKIGIEKLPYAYSALEKFIDSKTMNVHYNKHYKGYVEKLNKIISKKSGKDMELEEIVKKISKFNKKVRNNAGGAFNHALFWKMLSPKKQNVPEELLSKINEDFKTFKNFKKEFQEVGLENFGSGWVWLILSKTGKLKIMSTPNQDNPLMNIVENGGYPILGLDLWEHAYYLKYQNKKEDYIEKFWDYINWEFVYSLYKTKVKNKLMESINLKNLLVEELGKKPQSDNKIIKSDGGFNTKKFREYILSQYPKCSPPVFENYDINSHNPAPCVGKIDTSSCKTSEGIIGGNFSVNQMGSIGDWSTLNWFDTNSLVHKKIKEIYTSNNPNNLDLNTWIIENISDLVGNDGKYTKDLSNVILTKTSGTLYKGTKLEEKAIEVLKGIYGNKIELNRFCDGDVRDRLKGQDLIATVNGVTKHLQIKPFSPLSLKYVKSITGKPAYEIGIYFDSTKYSPDDVQIIGFMSDNDYIFFDLKKGQYTQIPNPISGINPKLPKFIMRFEYEPKFKSPSLKIKEEDKAKGLSNEDQLKQLDDEIEKTKLYLQSLIDKKGSLGGGDITEELYKLTDSLESLYNQKSKLL